jgi:hypothetical protein
LQHAVGHCAGPGSSATATLPGAAVRTGGPSRRHVVRSITGIRMAARGVILE